MDRTKEVKEKKNCAENKYNSKKSQLAQSRKTVAQLKQDLRAQLNLLLNLNANQEVLKNKLLKSEATAKTLESEFATLRTLESSEKVKINELEKNVLEKEKRIREYKSDIKLLESETKRLEKLALEYKDKEEKALGDIKALKETQNTSLVDMDNVSRQYNTIKKDYELILNSCENHKFVDHTNALVETYLTTADKTKVDPHPTKFHWFHFTKSKFYRICMLTLFYAAPIGLFMLLEKLA